MNRASLKEVRLKNKELLKKVIFQNPNISRVELTKLSGLSGGTITNLVTELLADGEIIESREMESTGGRRRTGLLVNNKNGDIIIFEAKQRYLAYKRYDLAMVLIETKTTQMNYINGNLIVDFILETIKGLEKEPLKVGLLVEENISEAQISYMLSTGLSQENIPMRDALKMYLKKDITIEFSSKYILEEELLNEQFKDINNYVYASLDYEMTAQVYMDRKIVKHSGDYTISLSPLIAQLELLEKWQEGITQFANTNRKTLIQTKQKSLMSSRKPHHKGLIDIITSVLLMINVFYKLDAIFLVGKGSDIQGIDREILKSLDKKLERNKIRLVQVIEKNDGEYSDEMVKKLAESYMFS